MLAYYENKDILITGAAGYIGSSLIQALSTVHCNIIALDKKGNFSFDNALGKAKISIFEADIRDREIWHEVLKKTDILFHLAAQTSSRFANENPIADLELNLFPVVNIIEICQKNNLSPDIIYSGTVTQVGFTKSYPVNETSKDGPITVYDINKLAAEKYLQYYSNQLKKRAVVLRLPNVYGPGPKSSSSDRGILNVMMRKAINHEALTIYGDGKQVRDYIFIDDVAGAFLTAGAKIDVLKGSYYVIGSGIGHTVEESFNLIKKIAMKKLGGQVKIIHISAPEDLSRIEYRNFVADTAKFKKLTGWRAVTTLREGIERTIEYFLKES